MSRPRRLIVKCAWLGYHDSFYLPYHSRATTSRTAGIAPSLRHLPGLPDCTGINSSGKKFTIFVGTKDPTTWLKMAKLSVNFFLHCVPLVLM